jgi:hypothetical protein
LKYAWMVGLKTVALQRQPYQRMRMGRIGRIGPMFRAVREV